MAINIPILSSLDASGFEKAAKQFSALKTNGERANFAVNKAAIPAAAALAAVGAAAFSAVKEAAADQKAQELLALQLVKTTGATDDQIKANERFITSTSISAAVTDDELRPALATLVRGTGDLAAAQDQLTLALDISAATGKDLGTVSVGLSKLANGQFGALTKLGIPLDANIIKTKDYAAAQDVLDKQFGGASKTAAETVAGRFKSLSIAFDETKEAIGVALMPAVMAILKPLQRLGTWASTHTTIFLVVGGVITGLAIAIVAVNIAMKVWTATTKAFTAVQTLFNVAVAANPIGVIVIAIGLFIAALVIAYQKFDFFREMINKSINFIIGYFEFMVNSWIKVINAVATGINKFTGLFSHIGINIGKIGTIGEVSFGRIGDSVEMSRGHLLHLDDDIKVVKKTADDIVPTFNDFGNGLGKIETSSKKTAAAFAKMRAEIVKLRAAEKARAEALATTYENALNNAKDFLANAQKDFRDFASGISGAITGAFSFTDALEIGKNSGLGFIEGLRIQANEAGQFGERIALLVARGLSGPALDQVVKAGAKAGTVIADELLNTVGGIDIANQLTADVQGVADRVGQAAAVRFKQAGIDNATAYISGVQATIDRYKLLAMYVGTDDGTAGRFAADIAGLASIYGGLTAMASGGIVTSPTMALLGESGPEAVIPLGSGGGLGNTYNISVDAGIAGNPVEIGQQIVTAISKYERSAGTNWRS